MTETIHVEVPRRGVGSDLTEALAAAGLDAEIEERDDAYALKVRFRDDEHERLIVQATDAIEAYLSERMLPLVVQRGNGGVVVRPPSD